MMKVFVLAVAGFAAGYVAVSLVKEPPPVMKAVEWSAAMAPRKLRESEKINMQTPGFFARLSRDAQIDLMNSEHEWRRDVRSPLNQLDVEIRNWKGKTK